MIGNVRKRRKNRDGTTSYQLRVMVDGHAYQKTVRCRSDREADKALTAFVSEIDAGRVNWGQISWPDLCDAWLRDFSRLQHKRSTYEANRRKVDDRIRGAWKKQAAKVTRVDVQAWVNEMATEVSPKTVRNVYGIARQIFAWAVQMDLITSSPCEHIALPKAERKEARFLNEDEFAALWQIIREDAPLKYQAAFVLAAFGGLRKGEVLGLRWDDLDLAKGTYSVTLNRLAPDGGGSYVDTPKTKTSVRRGFLPEVALSVLREHKDAQSEAQAVYGERWQGGEYVVSHEDGSPVQPQALAGWVRRFREDHPDAPLFTMHALRHTHASMLRHIGADLDEIQARLGHADKTTTARIYVHLFEDWTETDRRNAERLDAYLSK